MYFQSRKQTFLRGREKKYMYFFACAPPVRSKYIRLACETNVFHVSALPSPPCSLQHGLCLSHVNVSRRYMYYQELMSRPKGGRSVQLRGTAFESEHVNVRRRACTCICIALPSLQSAAWPLSQSVVNFTVPPQLLSVIKKVHVLYIVPGAYEPPKGLRAAHKLIHVHGISCVVCVTCN